MEGTKGSMKQVLDLEGERMEREIACFKEKENSAFYNLIRKTLQR